jgi:hypothetical protein
MTPYHVDAVHFPKERISRDIDAFFTLFERIGHLDFEGGETLLHPEISDVVRYALKYKNRFDGIYILTNGTILPKRDLLELGQKENILFLIDDYGPALSTRKEEMCGILDAFGIAYRIDTYWGDDQYYGGWLDMGDAQYKGYSPDELAKVYDNCRSGGGKIRTPYAKNGKLFVCEWQAAMMKHIPLVEGEYVDLTDLAGMEHKFETIRYWQNHPVESCKYCNGFNVNAERIPAAEQLTLPEFNDPALKIAQAIYRS